MFCHTAEIHKVYAFAYTVTDFLEEDSFPKKNARVKKPECKKKGYIQGYELASHGSQTWMNEEDMCYILL